MFRRNRGYGGGYQNRGFRGGYGGYQKQRVWPLFLIILVIISGVVFLKNKGKLGHIKNAVFKTPTEQVATVDQGIAKVNQANQNVANRCKRIDGDLSAEKDDVNDKVLTKDQFINPNDMNNFGKVYSVFVFSNTKADVPWLDSIIKARREGMTIKTINGVNIDSSESPLIYHFFNQNYAVKKTNPRYGQQDGYYHPFMILFYQGNEKMIITKPEDEKALFKDQDALMKQVDKNANNYHLPDPDVGIPYPDWSDMIKDAGNTVKNQTKMVYDNVTKSKSSN